MSYTVPMEGDNITLRILVNGTLATSITLSINIYGFMSMSVMNSGWSDIPYSGKFSRGPIFTVFMVDS